MAYAYACFEALRMRLLFNIKNLAICLKSAVLQCDTYAYEQQLQRNFVYTFAQRYVIFIDFLVKSKRMVSQMLSIRITSINNNGWMINKFTQAAEMFRIHYRDFLKTSRSTFRISL